MKNLFAVTRSRGVALKSAILIGALNLSISAHAVLPVWATDAVTDVGVAGDDSAAAVGPVFAGVLVAGTIFKLVKRFTNKV